MFGEKLLDGAHLIFGGSVVGQFLSGQPFSSGIAVVGVAALVFLYWLSYTLTRKKT